MKAKIETNDGRRDLTGGAKRRIVQIAVNKDELYALCDDGTVWIREWDGSRVSWQSIEDIPQ